MTFTRPDTGLDAPGHLFIRQPMMILPITRSAQQSDRGQHRTRSERRVDIRLLETGGADCAVAYVSHHSRQDTRFRGRNAYVSHHSSQDEHSRKTDERGAPTAGVIQSAIESRTRS
jgi:hypothetical protein